MSLKTIENYFQSNINKPFFMAVGDDEYRFLKTKLVEAGDIAFVRLSSCSRSIDKKPDLDKFREILRMADVDCDSNRVVVLGLGEYLALEGSAFAKKTLNEFISFNLGSAHVLFLLRGVSVQVRELMHSDLRYSGRQIEMGNDTVSSLSFMFSTIDLGMYDDTGFKKALEIAEEGELDTICVNTNMTFPNALYQVQLLKNPHEAICKKIKGFELPRSLGSDEYWEELLNDINKYKTLKLVFENHKIDENLGEFYQRIAGSQYKQWLFYFFLMVNRKSQGNTYLKMVLESSNDFEVFKKNILNAITGISHDSPDFLRLYEDRKRLVSQFPDADIAVFVSNNRINPQESIFKLTDNTLVEREEIIADIAQHGIPDGLERIYPALAMYLKKYYFQSDSIRDLLTKYFDEYKHQKVLNVLYPDFLEMVDDLAIKRVYNRLRTRDEIVAEIKPEGAFLRWVDALGVEYLSFIVEKAQQRGLAVSVSVGRSSLPTITGLNKHFYDTWPEEQRSKVEALDDTKHKERGGYKYSASNQFPIHLAKELDIISSVIDEAATDLGLRVYDRYIIASDHGASRLAVLRKKEEKYNTDTQGEHSGRCCKVFDGYELPFATEENGYIVLADYGRFRGSRMANVEVHGGASLEEVIVPIITLSLRDTSIVVQMVESSVKADYKTGVSITLYINKSISQPISIDYKGKKYEGVAIDSNHFRVDIPEITRAGSVPADVYLGKDLITHITIKSVGKSGSMNSDFENLF